MMTRVLVSVHFMRFKGNPAFLGGLFVTGMEFWIKWLFILLVNGNSAYSLHQYFFFSNLLFDILKQSKERHYQHTVNWFKK